MPFMMQYRDACALHTRVISLSLAALGRSLQKRYSTYSGQYDKPHATLAEASIGFGPYRLLPRVPSNRANTESTIDQRHQSDQYPPARAVDVVEPPYGYGQGMRVREVGKDRPTRRTSENNPSTRLGE
jgi:hypothetical protein